MPALNLLLLVNYHIIAQIVKPELVIGAVGNVGVICSFFLILIHSVNNKPHGKPHKAVKLAHPLGVALCKVIVNRHNMHTLA